MKLKSLLKVCGCNDTIIKYNRNCVCSQIASEDLLAILNKKKAPKVYKKLANARVFDVIVINDVLYIYLDDTKGYNFSKVKIRMLG